MPQEHKIRLEANLSAMLGTLESSLQSVRSPPSASVFHSAKMEQALSELTVQVSKVAQRVDAHTERLADLQAESLSGFAKLDEHARRQHEEVLQGLQTVIAANVVAFPTLMVLLPEPQQPDGHWWDNIKTAFVKKLRLHFLCEFEVEMDVPGSPGQTRTLRGYHRTQFPGVPLQQFTDPRIYSVLKYVLSGLQVLQTVAMVGQAFGMFVLAWNGVVCRCQSSVWLCSVLRALY